VKWYVRAEESYAIGYDMINDESDEIIFILLARCYETIIFILNRVRIKYVDKTPYKVWTRRVFNLSFLKI
jgi:hypothetical protein